jgi:NitT/TauT family transport system substrate-binding protein
MRVSRRTALSAAAATLAAPRINAQTVTRLRVGIIPVVDIAPLHAAIRQNYFAAEGLEIDTSPAPGGAALLPALAAGTFQIGFSNIVSILLGIQEGIEFRFLAGSVRSGERPPDINGLVVRKGSGLATGKDFEGKRLASNTRANIIWLRGVAWVAKTGGDWRRVNMVEVPFPQMADALVNSQIDGALINEPFLSNALATMGDRIERIAWTISETAPGSSIAQYAAMRDWLSRNGETAEKFARALYRGVDWVEANRGPAVDELISSYTRIPVERLRTLGMPVFEKAIPPASIEEVHRAMGEFGIGGRLPPARELLFRTAQG